jgi:hypothetical protein
MLLMGTGPLATVAGMIWASKAPYGLRAAGTLGCVALAVLCVVFAVVSFFDQKKRKRLDEARALERKRLRNTRVREATLKSARAASTSGNEGRRASGGDRSSRGGS